MPRHLLRSTGQNVCEETRNAPSRSRAGAGPPPGVPVLPLCALRARPSPTPGSEAPPPLPPSAVSTSPAQTQPCCASRRLLARHRPGPARPPGVASAGGRPQGAHVSLHRRPCPSAPELPARCRRSPWARLSPRARECLVAAGHTSSAAAAASRNKRSQGQHSGPQGRLCPSETLLAKRAAAPAADPCPGSTHGRGCPGAGGG